MTVLNEMAQKIDELTERKKILSRKIGQAKKNGEDFSEILKEMKSISIALKPLMEKIKEERSKSKADSKEKSADQSKQNGNLRESEIEPFEFKSSGKQDVSVSVSLAFDSDESDWNQFVESHDRSTPYHLFKWRRIINELFGHQTYYFIARNRQTNVVEGVLPSVRLNSKLFGDFLVSMPYFSFGGALGSSVEVESSLLAALNENARELGCKHVEYRHLTQDFDRFPHRSDKVLMMLELPESIEALDKKLGSKMRAQRKRAFSSEKITTEFGKEELLGKFYQVFSRNMRDLGTPVYGKDFFKRILQEFPEEATICVISVNGQPGGVGFLMAHKDRLEIPWASTLSEYNPISLNMAMYWKILNFAIEHQFKVFDFGRSTVDCGTYRFKKQWGAKPHQLYWHYWLADGGDLPQLNPNNPKYQLMINTWKKLPVKVANTIGPQIVKNLP